MFGAVQPDKSKYDLEMDKYIVKLVKLEPCTSQFGNGKGVKWYFNVARRGDPPDVIMDAATGDKMELWQFSDAELTPNSKPGKWAAALLQREIAIGDDGEQLAAEMLNKTALAMIGPNKQGKGNSILAMEPYTKPAGKNGNGNGKAQPAKAPPAEPVADSLLTEEETAAGVGASDDGF